MFKFVRKIVKIVNASYMRKWEHHSPSVNGTLVPASSLRLDRFAVFPPPPPPHVDHINYLYRKKCTLSHSQRCVDGQSHVRLITTAVAC